MNHPRTLCEDHRVDGTFRKCHQNQVTVCAKQQVSTQTVGEPKMPWNLFSWHAHEGWERNGVNLETQTTLLNTYPPRLIATILKALREQLEENDQMNAIEEIAGPVPEIPLE